ncbi:uncharacterized mitochondrial protein AtMg00810-like [Andrographis paniculata]|uniref:uncharacterized mitochondrial protein AtMg00810-like n=1 Tax=Andrographis paniculata TaxID=175694 RepID=UPI0021E9216F|nr:uncharacterized mitochondrial protein AtMg00810-like [Andrographis paniculata]
MVLIMKKFLRLLQDWTQFESSLLFQLTVDGRQVHHLDVKSAFLNGELKEESVLIVGVYVDDLIVAGESLKEIDLFKKQMMSEFEMSDLGLLTFYLGIEVAQEQDWIILKQSSYMKKVLDQFGMGECNATRIPMEQKIQLHKDPEGEPVDETEYRQIIGCLRYLLHTRPDLSFSVGMLSQFIERPTIMHYNAIKQVLRNLKVTITLDLCMEEVELRK